MMRKRGKRKEEDNDDTDENGPKFDKSKGRRGERERNDENEKKRKREKKREIVNNKWKLAITGANSDNTSSSNSYQTNCERRERGIWPILELCIQKRRDYCFPP
jgi:hypothetical protein